MPPTPLHKKLRPKRLLVRLAPRGRTITRLHDSLEGLLSIEESRFLHTAPTRLHTPNPTIVEIGSYRGKSCVLMALAAPAAHITCIDPHEPTHFGDFSSADHDAFMNTIRAHHVADRVTHIRKPSHDARADWPDDKPIDLLWIDGDHSYDGARTDLADWTPLLRHGAILAAHDAFRPRFPGVIKAWREIVEPDPAFEPTRRVRTIAWTRRI